MFVKQFEVSNLAVFAYLVGCEKTKEALVVDPADNIDLILKEAERQNLTIQYIVNTHGHVDHIMGNKEAKEKTGAKILIHEADAPLLQNIPPMFLSFFSAKPSPPADVLLKGGDTITIGDISLSVIHTPGHSLGSICLYTDLHLFTGDLLFVGGVGRTDVPGGSWKTMMNSITEKVLTLPDETVILPGHNYGYAPTSTVAREKASNPFIAGSA